MNNKKTISFVTLGIIGLLGISLVMAYQGDPNVQGPNYSEDRHAAMQEAFETGNYDGWVALMTQDGRHPRIVDIITSENFEEFAEAHQSKDKEELKELKAELGIGQGKMNKGSGNGMHNRANNINCPCTN
jgi:hypothetical protein